MKPFILFFLHLWRTSGRRRQSLVSLTTALLLILGFSTNSLAADPCAVPGTCTVTATVIKDYRLVSSGASVYYDVIEIYVTYTATGLPVNGAVFNFMPQGATSSVALTTGPTYGFPDGTIDYQTSSTVAGTSTVAITTSWNYTSTVPVNFVPVAGPVQPNGPDNVLVVDVTDQQAGGSTPDQIHAHLEDASSNPVTGATVTFYLTGGGGTAGSTAVFAVTETTGSDGNAYLPITDITAGTVILGGYYTVGGVNYNFGGTSVSVNFIANVASPTPPAGTPNGTNFTVTLDGAIANGVDTNGVLAHITDNFGNPVPDGTLVTIAITGNGTAAGGAELPGNVQTITVATVNGNVYIPITDTQVGTVELSAAINNGTDPITGSTKTVTFVAGPAVPSAPGAPTGPTSPGNPTGTTGTLLSVVTNDATADGVAQNSVQAHITDANGNAVAGQFVTITIITGGTPGATANAQFSNGTTTITVGPTDANGNVVIPITDITMGDVWISAALTPGGTPITGSHQVVTFVAGTPVPVAPGAPTGPSTPGNPTGTTGTLLTITRDSVSANNIQIDSVNAHITDQYGNAVAGVSVTFTITTGGTLAAGVAQLVGNVQTITLVTDANGNIEAGIISPTAGTVSIEASINGGSLINGSAQTVTFLNTPDVTNPETRLIVVVYEAIANGLGSTVVEAHVVDQNGVPLPNQDVTFAIDSGSAIIMTAQPVTTDANGNATIMITSKTPGYVLVTATVGGQDITFGSPARVKFVPINIYFPPVFTPNGDGTNDVLKPILVGISQFHYFSVYNRWGNLIYQSQDPNAGWDGRFKGVPQPVETYLWIAEGVDIAGKTVVQKGMTSLVR